ncbi:hypothetical protein [Rhodoplanes sp. SY1]|uniref:hypothetical protein n=1 Tax=Rhodoplanes sp. SY1 TaxID=3166646 RepID=UPI0038B51C87
MLKGILGALALAGTALTTTVLVPLAATAQEFPTRPITLIVPAPPGGGTDVFARQIAEAVEPILKQNVV